MRKRFMNLSKRCMVAIMSAAFIMSSVTVSMAFPVGVYAEILQNNDEGTTIDLIRSSDTMDFNYGTVTSNDGSIIHNIGKVETNYGYVNHGISNNEGEVEDNLGLITSNTGSVDTNINLVQYNYGTIGVNDSEATVGINYGTVSHNQGEIASNFDGTVTNEGEGHILNQYYSVTLSNTSNITAEYGVGFRTVTVDAQRNKKQFIQVTEDGQDLGNDASGQITISPKENYKLTGNDTEGETTSFRYQLREDGGKYYLTIINPKQALTIDPTTLGLIISQIQKQENLTISQVYVDDPGDTNSTNNDDSGYIPTTTISRTQLLTNAMLADSTKTTFNLEYKNQSNLTCKDFEQLCSTRNNVPKNCYFNVDGKQYILQIPALDPNNAAFKACLAKLQSEENGLAGPLTIAKIFKDQGVTCTEIKPQIASAATAAVAPASDFDVFTAQQNAQINALLQQISALRASGRRDLLQALTQSGFDLNIANYSMLDAGTCDLLGQVLDAGVPVKIDYTYLGISFRTTIPAYGKSSLSSLASDGVVTGEELRGAFETKTM